MMFYYPLTTNVRLELSDVHHAAALFNIINEERTAFSQWFSWVDMTNSVDDVSHHIRGEREKWSQNNGINCVILEDGNVIGMVGFHEFNRANNSASLGYWLSSKCQGRGVMTLAVQALMKYAFEKEQINKVILRCAMSNDRSRRVAERLGMELEGVLREEELINGIYVDNMQFSLLRKQYYEGQDKQ